MSATPRQKGLIHIRIAGEGGFIWPRVLCGARGKANRSAKELRAGARVTCVACMVAADWWLEHGRGKRPTIRRLRAAKIRAALGRGP